MADELALIKALGITREDVLEKLTEAYIHGHMKDDDWYEGEISKRLEAELRLRLDVVFSEIFHQKVDAGIELFLQELTFKETNGYGEAKGESRTFREFIAFRIDQYLRQEVNWKGETKEKANDYQWKSAGQRLATMVHRHIDGDIEAMVKAALVEPLAEITDAVNASIKLKGEEIAARVKGVVAKK